MARWLIRSIRDWCDHMLGDEHRGGQDPPGRQFVDERHLDQRLQALSQELKEHLTERLESRGSGHGARLELDQALGPEGLLTRLVNVEVEPLKRILQEQEAEISRLRDQLQAAADPRAIAPAQAGRDRRKLNALRSRHGVLYGLFFGLLTFILSHIAMDLASNFSDAKGRHDTLRADVQSFNTIYQERIAEMQGATQRNTTKFDKLEPVLRTLILRSGWDEENPEDMEERERLLSILNEGNTGRDLYGEPLEDGN